MASLWRRWGGGLAKGQPLAWIRVVHYPSWGEKANTNPLWIENFQDHVMRQAGPREGRNSRMISPTLICVRK
jgi:hypothetical protein